MSGVTPAVAHVVARTSGATRNYYYRRREGEVSAWTPWEEIKLGIEDDPVIPVVWKDRLFLFWLKILKQAPLGPPPKFTADKLRDLNPAEIPSEAPTVKVQALLCWSEYCNGKWQATKTSDVGSPILIKDALPAGAAFDRSDLTLWPMKAKGESALLIQNVSSSTWFTLYNTHSAPVRDEDDESGMMESAASMLVGEPYP